MVVLSFFLCYNVQQAQQKNKRREAAFVFLCLLQRANLLRSRKERGSAGLRVCTRRGQRRRAKLLRSRRRSAEALGMDAEILHGERKRTQFL